MKNTAQLLKQARGFALAKFDQLRPPMTATLEKARKDLTALSAASGTHEALGTRLSKAFVDGLAEVLAGLRAFQSGYASNDPTQAIDPKADPAFSETNMTKAADVQTKLEAATAAEVLAFSKHASAVIKGADEMPVHEALDALAALIVQIDKGELSVRNDPMALTSTSAAGTVAPAGTSAASSAASNFATNPEVIGGPASSGSPGTSGVSGAAASTGAGNDPVNTPAIAGAGAAPSTTGVAALVSQDGGGQVQETTKAAPAAAVMGDNPLEDLAKAAPGQLVTGWTMDLNNPEFMTGRKKHDFGKDGTKPKG